MTSCLGTTRLSRPVSPLALLLPAALAAALAAAACGGGSASSAGGPGGPGGPGGGPPPALPVPIAAVADTELRDATEYVATLRSRHTTNVQPQVEGVLTRIFVKSGDRVALGAPLMQIDPAKQRATLGSQEATRTQKRAALNYAKQQEQRMETLYRGGAASKQQLDEAQSAMAEAQADYDALGAQVKEQEVQLGYYRVTAPAAGVVGDIPVRAGDRVTTATLLTTIDQNDAMEAYISVPLEHARDLKLGLPVEILSGGQEQGQSQGQAQVAASTRISFISPQVDDQTQQILVKAPVPNGSGLRSDQFVRARVVWSTHRGPVVPVLAVTRVNGQYFVFTAAPASAPGAPGAPGSGAGGGKEAPPGQGPPSGAPPPAAGAGLVAHQTPVQLGDLIGNDYVVLSGLQPGQRIVTAGVQKLADGMPIAEMPAGPASGGAGGSGAPPRPAA
jgi:RND family efflux transporter MFP subunit